MRRQALNVFRMRLHGRRGRPGHERHAHAQGRDERGDSRLGDERQRHALHHRLGRRAGAVSAHGARLPGGHRRARRARRCSSAPGGCRRRSSRASAAARTRWASSTPSSPTPTSSWSASRRRARDSTPSATRRRSTRGTPGVLHGALSYLLQDDARPGAPGALHLGGAGLSGRRARSTRSSRTAAARRTSSVTDDEALRRLPAAEPPRGDHPGARDGARRGVGRSASAAVGARDDACCSASAAAATRTWRR